MADLLTAPVLIFGTEQSLQSPRSQLLKKELEKRKIQSFFESNPQKIKKITKDLDFGWAILVALPGLPVLSIWHELFVTFKNPPHFAALVEKSIPPNIIKDWKLDPLLSAKDSLESLFQKMNEKKKKGNDLQLEVGIDKTLKLNEEESQESLPESGIQLPPVDPAIFLNQEYEKDSLMLKSGPKLELDSPLSLESDLKPEKDAAQVSVPTSTPKISPPSDEDWGLPVSVHSKIAPESPLLDVSTPKDNIWEKTGSTRPPLPKKSVQAFENKDSKNEATRLVSIPESLEGTIHRATPDSIVMFPNPHQEKEALSSEDMKILKRYSTIKDREAREKEAAAHVLRRQIEQLEDRLSKSDAERRRVVLKLEDAEAKIRALKDGRDQDKHHVSKIDQHHQEEMRALQLRLDNAQFQANKSEKKLEEFRERVRSDIQTIRARERDLANRLELQKRDAEALLSTKDERLLQQKREMDRMEFEIENLKERLVEETQKGEERAGKLSRAMQSLRLATGMLSGMEEEVLPGAFSSEGGESQGSGEGEAA